MIQRLIKLQFLCLIIILGFSACSKNSHFTVVGTVSGADGQMMYLENVGVSSVEMIDSVKLNANGKFKFKKMRPDAPEFYRLRLNNQRINFAIDSTETVSFVADAGTFAISYSVEGSENNSAIKQITLAQLDANQAINKIRKEYESKQINDSIYTAGIIEIVDAYKEVARQYIYAAPMSTAAYFALFQQIDGLLFFDLYDAADSNAFSAVATSFDLFYPNSERAKHLHNLALQSIKIIRGKRELDLGATNNIKEIGFLDIELPDIRNNKRKLSEESQGKVVLVNFTAYKTEWSAGMNMALGEVYLKYKEKGFEVFQISLDDDRHQWQNAAVNLPWICVLDPESVYSQIAALYNVKQLPAFFLIDKKGNLTKRLEDLNNLENELKALL